MAYRMSLQNLARFIAFFAFPSENLYENMLGCGLESATAWKHLSEKVKKHIKCSRHVENCLKLAFFGKTNIAEQLSAAYRTSIQRHKIEVGKYRHILSKIVCLVLIKYHVKIAKCFVLIPPVL